MDLRRSAVFLAALLALAASGALAQPRNVDGARPTRPAPALDETRQLRVPTHRSAQNERSAQGERCANFRAELRDAERAEREASTTTGSGQASLHRQRLLETSQKAGC